VLAREDLACGDRLAAFSLASFAGREHRAWPGAAAAAHRAGLSRSRYLQARDRLVRRGMNEWTVPDPRVRAGGIAPRAPRRVVPAAGARPLVGVAGSPAAAGVGDANSTADRVKGGQPQTVLAENRLTLAGLSATKGGQDKTLFDLPPVESPAESPTERVVKTQRLHARAGTNAVNPGIQEAPPAPLTGGAAPIR